MKLNITKSIIETYGIKCRKDIDFESLDERFNFVNTEIIKAMSDLNNSNFSIIFVMDDLCLKPNSDVQQIRIVNINWSYKQFTILQVRRHLKLIDIDTIIDMAAKTSWMRGITMGRYCGNTSVYIDVIRDEVSKKDRKRYSRIWITGGG